MVTNTLFLNSPSTFNFLRCLSTWLLYQSRPQPLSFELGVLTLQPRASRNLADLKLEVKKQDLMKGQVRLRTFQSAPNFQDWPADICRSGQITGVSDLLSDLPPSVFRRSDTDNLMPLSNLICAEALILIDTTSYIIFQQRNYSIYVLCILPSNLQAL